MLARSLYVLACVAVPVAWGVIVNWLFNAWWNRRRGSSDSDDAVFPDYQI